MSRKINEEHREVNRVYQLKQWKWGIIDQQICNKRNFLLVFFVIFLPEKAKQRCHLRRKTAPLDQRVLDNREAGERSSPKARALRDIPLQAQVGHRSRTSACHDGACCPQRWLL